MFRSTIRDVLWLTVVVAIRVGWWADCPSMARERKEAEQWLQIATDTLDDALATVKSPSYAGWGPIEDSIRQQREMLSKKRRRD